MFESLSSKYIPLIDGAYLALLKDFFGNNEHPVRDMLEYHYNCGGKRIRPLCVLSIAKGFPQFSDKMVSEQLLPFAVAVEMIHNATLIHDDLQDGDHMRRGKPTLWKRYSAAQAINCGDLSFFLAMQSLVKGKYAPETSLRLQRLLNEKTSKVIVGQAEEFSIKENLITKRQICDFSQYERMARAKTAALFSLPIVGGAIIMGASEQEIHQLGQAAEELGYAFQIQDDFVDLWGAKGRERVGSDIAEGKISFFIAKAASLLKPEELENLKDILIKPREITSETEIGYVIRLLEVNGLKAAGQRELERLLKVKCEGNLSKLRDIYESLQKLV